MFYMNRGFVAPVTVAQLTAKTDGHIDLFIEHLRETDHHAHVQFLLDLQRGGDALIGGLPIEETEGCNRLRLFYEDGVFKLKVVDVNDTFVIIEELFSSSDLEEVFHHFEPSSRSFLEDYVLMNLPIEALAPYEPFSLISSKSLSICWMEREMCLNVIEDHTIGCDDQVWVLSSLLSSLDDQASDIPF